MQPLPSGVLLKGGVNVQRMRQLNAVESPACIGGRGGRERERRPSEAPQGPWRPSLPGALHVGLERAEADKDALHPLQ